MKEDPMRVTDLIPWKHGRGSQPAPRTEQDPVTMLQQDVNRAVGDFLRMFNTPFAGWPGALAASQTGMQVDVSETDKEVKIAAELPGIDEKDIDVRVTDDMVAIRGEKKADREAKDRGYVLRERSFGVVERAVPLPDGVDANAAKATFKSGVVTITIPKTKRAQSEAKRISVRSG
jgi:HSP20 family protein